MSAPLTEQQASRLKKLAALGSISLAVTLILIKTAGVVLSGSLSVLSSMIDSLADLFASSVTFLAVRVSGQPADPHHRYGHGKAEALSALIQSAFIMGSGLFIMYDGIRRFFNPQPLAQTGLGIVIMLISLILTLALISFQNYVANRTHSQAIRADAAHYNVDVLTNISIIITLIVVKWFGLDWFDTLTAFIVSAYLLVNAYKLAKEATSMLMDKELGDDIREQIAKIVLSCDHIQGLHDLRTRDLGGAYMIELHLELDGRLDLTTAHQYTDNVETELKKNFPNAQIIIHQDPAGLTEDRLDDKINKAGTEPSRDS